MEEKLWRRIMKRNHGGEIKEQSWDTNHGGDTTEQKLWRRNHREIMEEIIGESMEEKSWRNNHGREIWRRRYGG